MCGHAAHQDNHIIFSSALSLTALAMDSILSTYDFDEYGTTWITCDLCSGSFQREAELCQLCQGSKVRRVTYEYLAAASAPPQVQPKRQPPSPPKDNNRGCGRGPSSGRGVYSRRS
ncbi:hypothetical protein FZEAL_2868 [Fusarium zealandicum]|uniref:Uncharacterized protein n=1 Tax=Fusarium zealandicum TaxID=1053134 RepID=A0A8H4UQN4_9HYPO|nr:hypothetical protein FZEAL_2868 [Fusarium zealandicum]